MNLNYLPLPRLPDYDHYGDVLAAMVSGEGFMTTGEILLPEVTLAASSGGAIGVKAKISWTFPLRMAEVVWGNGSQTLRRIFPLENTHEFGTSSCEWTVEAPGWKWARMTVWDVAGNGAFTQPVWR